MPDINILDGSPASQDLLLQTLNALGIVIPGPYNDNSEALADGVPDKGIYTNAGQLYQAEI